MIYPLCQEVSYQDPVAIFYAVLSQSGGVFLDSSRLMEGCGRYSYIAMDPFCLLKAKDGVITLNEQVFSGDPFTFLDGELKKYPLVFHPDLPPFQGGVAGYFAYDLCHQLEKLPVVKDDMQFADLILGFYDLIIAFDHAVQRAWIFSSGYPLQDRRARQERARVRCEWLQALIKNAPSLPSLSNRVCDPLHIKSNFSQNEYEKAVKKVIDYILAGDIFEANISQRFKTQLPDDFLPFELYRRIRLMNAAPFSAYLNFGDTVIVSASPERFLKLSDKKVEMRPIKGTRPRGKNKEEDLRLSGELVASEKDHAENVMIVDLLRNDLSRVCKDGTVNVPQLCNLESYATVHHLVSVVTGCLRDEHNVIDLLRATFPGGSITGAPKIRSMEIISEIEKIRRGPYCGSIAYIGFNGDCDSSIVIRTYAIKNNCLTFQAGGAVIADSDPVSEYAETLVKANALYKALTEVPECMPGVVIV